MLVDRKKSRIGPSVDDLLCVLISQIVSKEAAVKEIDKMVQANSACDVECRQNVLLPSKTFLRRVTDVEF